MTRDQKVAALGFAWTVNRDRRDGVAHLTKRGIAVCGKRFHWRDTTPYFGDDWPRLCKICVKISGAGR